MSRWIFSRNHAQSKSLRLKRKTTTQWTSAQHIETHTKNEHKLFICLLENTRDDLANIVLHPYLFTPNYFYSFHFIWLEYRCWFLLLFSWYVQSLCCRWDRGKALGFFYFTRIHVHIFFIHHRNPHMISQCKPKDVNESLCAHHTIFIHIASYLNLLKCCVCVSFCIIDTSCHWNRGGNIKKEKNTREKATTT